MTSNFLTATPHLRANVVDRLLMALDGGTAEYFLSEALAALMCAVTPVIAWEGSVSTIPARCTRPSLHPP